MSSKKETTILEASNINYRRIYDGYKDSTEVPEIHHNTQDWENIDQLICAQESAYIAQSISAQEVANIDRSIGEQEVANIDHRIHPREIITDQDGSSSDLRRKASCRNDETNGTPTSSISTYQCVKTQPSEERRLPDSIRKLFPGCIDQEIGRILKKPQDEKDKIWAEIDKKYENQRLTLGLCSQMRNECKKAFELYLSKEFPRQLKMVYDVLSIVERPSYGIIFGNMKNELLGVQNHYGSWSAVKGHQKFEDDGTLETPWETSVRELFEELSIKLKRSKCVRTITQENIGLLAVNKANFIQCHVDTGPNTNDRSRLIGLFFVRVDEKKWKFSLKDNKENMACEWLKMDDIINDKPERGRDKYYTLRPFVQYLKDHPIH